MTPAAEEIVEITHWHGFCGSGGGALGFQRGQARHGRLTAKMRCLGGVDVDPVAIADFERFVGVHGTVLDLFDEEQYRAFHGCPPPRGWREATPMDILASAGGEYPDLVFLSAPCKGFSGLLAGSKSGTAKYQALNRLTVRGIRLMLEAFATCPPKLVIFENVPLIATRGRALLNDIKHELEMAGYVVAETAHDCGELGGLAQHRRRFLLVARHRAQVPPFLYEPPRQRVRAVGELVGLMPMPEAPGSGPMHQLPRITKETWCRLALIQPGKDARSLHGLDLSRFGLTPMPRLGEHAKMRVEDWERPVHTITAVDGRVGSGALSLGDVRVERPATWGGGEWGVIAYDQPVGAVRGESLPSNGPFSLGDVRPMAGFDGDGTKYPVTPWAEPAPTVIASNGTWNGACSIGEIRSADGKFNNCFRIVRYDEPAPAVTGGAGPSSGGLSLADVRPMATSHEVYGVTRYDEPSGAITSQAAPGAGHFSLADIRFAPGPKQDGDAFASSGHYGVVPWEEPTGAVVGSACIDNGAWSVGDRRFLDMKMHEKPDPAPVILSLWNTWNRPFTTLELAALQGYPWEELMGTPMAMPEHRRAKGDARDDGRWRMHIGNSVPVDSAAAIASVMAHTILLARAGVAFQLSAAPIWVRRLAVPLAIDRPVADWM